MWDNLKPTFTSIFLIISIILKLFSFFTPIALEYRENSDVKQLFVIRLVPFLMFFAVLLIVIELIALNNLLDDMSVDFNQMNYKLLLTSFLIWFLSMVLFSTSVNQTRDSSGIGKQSGFGYYIIWLSVWFQALSLIFIN